MWGWSWQPGLISALSQTKGQQAQRVQLGDSGSGAYPARMKIGLLWVPCGPQRLHLENEHLDIEESPPGHDSWRGDKGAEKGSTEVLPPRPVLNLVSLPV